MPGFIPWDPFAGLSNLHSQLDDAFGQLWSSLPNATSVAAADVYTDEEGKQLVTEIQAPGFDKDDIEVNVHNGMLEIKGEKHQKDEQKAGKKRNYVLRESHASFYRSIALPKTAEADHVTAHFDNGVLKVTIPLAELPAPQKVAIQSGAKRNEKEK